MQRSSDERRRSITGPGVMQGKGPIKTRKCTQVLNFSLCKDWESNVLLDSGHILYSVAPYMQSKNRFWPALGSGGTFLAYLKRLVIILATVFVTSSTIKSRENWDRSLGEQSIPNSLVFHMECKFWSSWKRFQSSSWYRGHVWILTLMSGLWEPGIEWSWKPPQTLDILS